MGCSAIEDAGARCTRGNSNPSCAFALDMLAPARHNPGTVRPLKALAQHPPAATVIL
jgi:hypothetical protein